MLEEGNLPLFVKPIIRYPRRAQVGKTYLMTIYLQTSEDTEWQYEDEEYPIYCMVDASPLFICKPVGEPCVVLHRFGGSYAEAKFLLTAALQEAKGDIQVTLVNGWGVAIRVFKLDTHIEYDIQKSNQLVQTPEITTLYEQINALNNLDFYNIITSNTQALETLAKVITDSQGRFSLCFVVCNYSILRQQTLRRLELELGNDYQIHKVTLKSNAISLYSTIHASIGNSQPSALMILGLEFVEELDDILRMINHIRDEFRKSYPFPILFWVNDELLRKLGRFAPDFTSWAATPIRFEMTTEELQDFLKTKTNSLFAKILGINGVPEGEHPHTTLGQVWDYNSYEFRTSIKELQHRGIELEPELDASVKFIAGLDYYASNRIDLAIEYFQESLQFWSSPHPPVPPSTFVLRQGILLFYLGLSYYRLAERIHVEHQERWQEAKSYLQQCLDVFETARRPDLMAQIIGLLCDVLQHLKLWDELQQLALKSQNLHHDYDSNFQIACDSGFLAQVAVAKENWVIANKQARVALLRLYEASERKDSHPNS